MVDWLILYYNYHGIIKSKIKKGELLSYQIVDKYNNISPCLLLFFKSEVKPIREYRFHEYLELIDIYYKRP